MTMGKDAIDSILTGDVNRATVSVSQKKLGVALDAAEAAVKAGGYLESDFDYDDADGFQHDSERCPTCVFCNLSAAYTGALLRAAEPEINRLWRKKLGVQEVKKELLAYREAADLAAARLADLEAAGGYSAGDHIVASVAAAVADERRKVMAQRLAIIRRDNLWAMQDREADKRAGIVRHYYQPKPRVTPKTE